MRDAASLVRTCFRRQRWLSLLDIRRDTGDLVVIPTDRAEREGEVVETIARMLAALRHRDGSPALYYIPKS
jgi:hypothetical protein